MGTHRQLMNTVSVLDLKETTKECVLKPVSICFSYVYMVCDILSLFVFQSKEEKYFINNHLSFRVMYHKDPESDTARIVGFEVTPNRLVFCPCKF